MKRIMMRTLKGLGWLLLALLALLLAWLASNNRWVDARDDAIPPALRQPAPSLPPERNAFFTLLGLDAPEGADPQQVGRQRWAAAPADPSGGAGLRWPQPGPDDAASSWSCRADREDCVGRWREQSAALQRLMQQHATLGRRCEALADADFALDELLPEPSAELKTPDDQYASKVITPVTGRIECARWLRIQAVLAQQRGDQAELRAALQRGQRYVNGLLAGSRSLIGHLLAWHIAADHWQLLAALSARQPALTDEAIRLVESLPPAALDASRWMVSEAFFSRQVNREMGLSCGAGGLHVDTDSWTERVLNCANFGFMPRATQQLFDQQWLQALALARQGPLALLDWSPQPQGARLFGFAWYNTLGHVLVDVAAASYPGYGKRQADLLLHHQAALLALKAAAQPTDARAAWLSAQPMDERLRARITLEGAQIVASPWAASGERAQPAYYYPIPRLQDS